MSLPVRGEWIEIALLRERSKGHDPSLPVRGEWIEIFIPGLCYTEYARLSP